MPSVPKPTTPRRTRCGPGEPVELDPLPSFERRIVHEYLRDRGDVETHSEGEEPERFLVISPQRALTQRPPRRRRRFTFFLTVKQFGGCPTVPGAS